MQTEIIHITDVTASAEDIRRAAAVIRDGGLVVFPTETVYGLGGNGLSAEAATKIYAAKGRPSDNPLIIHVAKPSDASLYTTPSHSAWTLYEKLARAFMPGPLTVILPKATNVPYSTTGGLDTVAVRCPSHPVAHALIEAAELPIAAPSANLSGKPSPTEAEHVIHDLNGRVDMILDGGSCDIGLESTIVKIDEDEDGQAYLTLLRPGGITYDALCLVCDRVEVARAVSEQLAADEKPLSPGMKYRHYAPSAPLVLLDGNPSDVLAFLQARQSAESCAILCYDEEVSHLAPGQLLPIGPRADVAAHAHNLFKKLREADSLVPAPDVIYAHLPDMNGLGLALYNRMIRAAAHTVLRV
ncbi:MAG: threonylcarbamoyl-AMP synthase [Clostridia bacterium]|nr:threonylcarbamoyl-AMP synthase [Clostridia bacterium]